MTIFPPSTATSANALSVAVPPFVVWISRCTANADPTLDPSYGNWTLENRLEVTGIFKSSSVVGQSYAMLKVATGAPLTADNTNIEATVLLSQGDRVLIGLDEGGGSPRWLFGGYMVLGKLEIHGKAESEEFKIVGPEWIWGAGPIGTGSILPVCGQVRRKAIADDAFAVATVTTAYSNLAQITDLPAVFNPLGRKNMSGFNATFTTNTAAISSSNVLARTWETEDRKLGGTDIAATWTKDQAVLSLYLWYNDPAKTGITLDDSVLPTSLPMRHVNVEGLGLFEAFKHVCGQEWAFYVDPTPDTSPTTANNHFTGFKLHFFNRSSGATANLVLNPLGTAGGSASFSVARLQAAKDATKVCNKVMVLAKHLRHVKLQYFGSHTGTSTTSTEKKLSLQHGWTQGDGDLKDYAKQDASGNWNVDATTIDALTKTDLWTNQFTTKGPSFAANSKVFRMFTWNEAGELANGGSDPASNKASYGPPSGTAGAGVSLAYYAPDLTGIADATNHAGIYCRRRRKLLDTAYFDSSIDSWQRLRPTLYIRAATLTSDTTYGNWYRVATHNYRVDEQRGAIWITHEDIAQWQPFLDANLSDDTMNDGGLQDERTFATLLFTGKLRLLLECSVETDWLKEYLSDVTTSAGVPLVRLTYIRADRDYYFTEEFADGVTSPSGETTSPRDDSTLAQAYADNAKLRGQDQITHASLLVEADWPEQPIGMMVTHTTGRVVNMTVNGTGKGSQIVATYMHVAEMKWELVTETAAMQYRSVEHGEINKYKSRRRGRFAMPADTSPLFVPDMPSDGSD